MTLKQYMEQNDLTAAYIAEKMGVSLSAVFKWMQGTRIPKLPRIKHIAKLTRGRVTPNDWN